MTAAAVYRLDPPAQPAAAPTRLDELPPTLRALVLRLADAVGSNTTKDKAYLATQLGRHAAHPYLSWKENEDGAAAATLDSYERVLAVLCIWAEERGITLDRLTVDHLRQVRDLYTRGQRRKVTAVFRDCFRWLYEEGRTPDNIAGRLRYPKRDTKVATGIFDDDEKFAIVTAQNDIMDRVGVLLLLRAGLRQGELRNVQVRDVNLVERYVIVRRGKGGRARTVPVKGELVRALEQLFLTDVPGLNRPRQLDEYLLCPTRGGRSTDRVPSKPMGKRGCHEWWYRCLQRAGIVDEGVTHGRRMHGARHTYATDMLRANDGNAVATSKNLGHSSIDVTVDLYGHFDLDDQRAAVAKLPEIGDEG